MHLPMRMSSPSTMCSGAIAGAPFAAVLSDRYGRRVGMFSGSIVIIIGVVIISTSSALAQFIVGRFILGFGIAIMTVAAPAYAVEISPPHWRGRCTGWLSHFTVFITQVAYLLQCPSN
jgi:MFS family permease